MKTVAELAEFAKQIGEVVDGREPEYKNIINNLHDGENVSFCCNNLSTTIIPPEIRGKRTVINCSVLAVTNRRFLIAGKVAGLFSSKETFESIELKKVKKMYFDDLFAVIETLESTYAIKTIAPTAIKHIGDNLWDAIEREKNEQKAPVRVVLQENTAEEIKKFKELLDMGAITQEEFDAKKKQLLGL